MKTVILYRPNSEHARAVETFAHDFLSRYQTAKLEMVSIDEREGIAMASLYDIMQFPALLVMSVDGTLQQTWQGEELPLIDAVAAYSVSNQ